MKTKQLMTCPECGEKKVALCQDAIIPFEIKQLKNGKIKVLKAIQKDVNYMDNTWLECDGCHSTSDDNKELGKLYQLID